jgi:succinate-semialdehyde dehydrogenase/glutarate-semialdehyde dehydrogenase
MSLQSINPTDGTLIKSYNEFSKKQLNAKIQQTHLAWKTWKETSLKERANLLKKLSKSLLKNKEVSAKLMALEMGKPLKQGLAEIEKCAHVCDFYAENTGSFLQDQIVQTEASKSFVSFQPLGPILAVMPWNFPFWQVFRFLAPALMAGNAALLKHASNVSGCALQIENIIKEAGFPDHLFQTLLISGKKVNLLIENPLIKAVTLTGSFNAGAKVAAKASSLIKKTVLELGGSDPYIILADANLELAAETCVNSRLINSGQSCIAAKRFIVVKDVANAFTKLFLEKMQFKIAGNPFESASDIGPMARADLRDELHLQVKKSIKKGAKCILGGNIPEGNHAFYPPTILINVKKGMPAYDEELFGPVASIIEAKNEKHAIQLANDSTFGLGAAVFTADKKKGELIATKLLDAGSCFVNSMVKSDPRLPFGGIKQSGYGRELGLFGIQEFVNIKTIYVA